MKQIIEFLRALSLNNNREWFNAHKAEYLDCKKRFEAFATQMIAGIREFDPSIGPLTVADCTYRIYRDTRFSTDKSPYKTQMGVFIAPGGKKSGYSGYYLQIGANESGYPGGCMLAAGNYYCEGPVLKLLREDIALDEGQEFKATLDMAPDFCLDRENELKRVPNGYDPSAPYATWLRLRNFCLAKDPGSKYMLEPNLLQRALADFKKTQPFIAFVNRAIAYAREND